MRPLLPPLPVFLLATALACGHPAATSNSPMASDSTSATRTGDTLVERTVTGTKGSLLLFSDGGSFDTRLKDLDYAGTLGQGPGKHVLLTADRTVDGLTEQALYIIDARDTVPPKTDREHSWNAPGRKLDGETGEPFLEAQVFYGEVLPDTSGVIWYERAVMPNGQVKENTTLLYNGPNGMDTLVFFGLGRMTTTQTLAYNGACHEIKGSDERQTP